MRAKAASSKTPTQAGLLRHMLAHAAESSREFAGHPFAGELVQAAVCAAPILAAANPGPELNSVLSWLTPQLAAWERTALDHANSRRTEYLALSTQYSLPSTRSADTPAPGVGLTNPEGTHPSTPAHLFEPFLHRHSAATRRRRGVFFTPEPLANYLITRIHALLACQFNISPHSALRTPHSAIHYLDPACGTGVFLLSILDHAHRAAKSNHGDWNAVVPDLLDRLIGIEILPAAAFLAKLNLTLKLAETGFDFKTACRLQIITGDALAEETQSAIRNPQSTIPVLLGNPPFSSLSTTTNPWIARLVRGDSETRGYLRAGDQWLGERKTWLHDDYVKFIRLAQWHVEQAGCGILGFVTNHGYLDNATFRLMRHELLRVFPQIEILDLHGNRKKHEVAPDGGHDENVFRLDQGISVALMSRPFHESNPGHCAVASQVSYAELWGPRQAKLDALENSWLGLRVSKFSPTAPEWRLVPPQIVHVFDEYQSGWSLADAMPVNTTAPVTARDHFVVAFTRDELEARLAEFRDQSIPDQQIRERYFQRTRSARYETGDTRGWKLRAARQTVATDEQWQEKIIRCLYRPFDWRYIFWHPAMIDWPRNEVTQHLLPSRRIENRKSEIKNLALIARRQQLPGHPCTFFWISDGLVLDGVIRSDNRGSESLFPLYLDPAIHPRANFAAEFIDALANAAQLHWQPIGRGDAEKSFGPEDLAAYIYALFHCPTYRDRYAQSLRTGFPRIVLPRNSSQFHQMASLGRGLISLHLLQPSLPFYPSLPHALSPSLLSFRAGGHLALKKWLQPKHRSPADSEYQQIVAAIDRTLEITPVIDAAFTQTDASANP